MPDRDLNDYTDRHAEGTRLGRFVVLHDVDGRTHAVAAGSVSAVSEADEGTLVLLAGGRLLQVPRPFGTVIAWLCGSGPHG